MTLIIDENLPPSWVTFLSQAGHEASHWRQIGELGDPDDVIFQYAKKNACIILRACLKSGKGSRGKQKGWMADSRRRRIPAVGCN